MLTSKSVVLLGILVVSGGAFSQSYPVKAVRLVVPFPPGGSSDAVARVLAYALPPLLGQQIVVDNRGGAGGNIAAEYVARTPADGYTLMIGTNSVLAINQALYSRVAFDPVKDFETVALVAAQPSVLVVHPSLPVHSVKELIALAKAKPGQLLCASSGAGTVGHLSNALFQSMAQVSFTHVPYKGGGPATIDLISGQNQLMIETVSAVISHLHGGKLRPLAATSAKRSHALPELPTISEAGVPGYEAVTWHGVITPAGTPPGIIERLNGEINRALASEDVKERFLRQGVDPQGGSQASFAAYLRSEIPKWGKIVRDTGAKVQ